MPGAVQAASAPDGDNHVFGIRIHGTDALPLDFSVIHPCVKVFLLNLDTGDFIPKLDTSKSVAYYEEGDVNYILPLMTQPFQMRAAKSITPHWEEMLLYNESFAYLRSFKDNLGIFFMVQDFKCLSPPLNNTNELSASGSGKVSGWHELAWAFLKPFPEPHPANTEKKVRLQLFKPCKEWKDPSEGKDQEQRQNLWQAWKSSMEKFKGASMFVTIQALKPPNKQQQQNSAREGDQPIRDAKKHLAQATPQQAMTLPRIPRWSRIPGQPCKIPKVKVSQSAKAPGSNATRGVSALKFSREGRLLACGSVQDRKSFIKVYDMQSVDGKAAASFPLWAAVHAHSATLIYDLDWAPQDGQLLSSAGDRTAKLWKVGSVQPSIELVQPLPHPSFVYSGRFHPSRNDLIATACHDRVVRLWRKLKSVREDGDEDGEAAPLEKETAGAAVEEDTEYHWSVLQELVGHKGSLSALEFDYDGQTLYSGDRKGGIKVWENMTHASTKSVVANFCFKKDIHMESSPGSSSASSSQGDGILGLHLHPGGKRLLVHMASVLNPLRTIDLTRQNSTIQQFNHFNEGSSSGVLLHFGSHGQSCITPCGNFLFSAAGSGSLLVWNFDTAELVHEYEQDKEITAIAFHPFENMLTIGGITGDINPVIYREK